MNNTIFDTQNLKLFLEQKNPKEVWKNLEKLADVKIGSEEKEVLLYLMKKEMEFYKTYKIFRINADLGDEYLYKGFLQVLKNRLKRGTRPGLESKALREYYGTDYVEKLEELNLTVDQMIVCIAILAVHGIYRILEKDLNLEQNDESAVQTETLSCLRLILKADWDPNKKTPVHVRSMRMNDVKKNGNNRLLKIKEIKEYFDKYIVGQEQAKFSMAIVGENLLHAIETKEQVKPILLSGPTGCGKTYLSTLLAKYLGLPYFIVDSTEYTETGFSGKDVKNLASTIASDIGRNPKHAAVVILDEWDKRCKPSHDKGGANVSAAAQHAFLKIFEKDYFCDGECFNQVLFVMTGTFYYSDEMTKVIDPKADKKCIGFSRNTQLNMNRPVENVDLREICKNAGMLPELIGRTQRFVMLDKLTEEHMLEILTRKNGLLTKMLANLKSYEIVAEISDEAKQQLVKRILAENLGARSVDNIVAGISDHILRECILRNQSYVYVDKGDGFEDYPVSYQFFSTEEDLRFYLNNYTAYVMMK